MKETNLIFIEHNKLLQENTLLNKQLYNYKEESLTLNKLDSIKTQQLKNYKNLTTAYEDKIENLNKELNKKEKSLLYWQIGGVSVSVGLALWLLLK